MIYLHLKLYFSVTETNRRAFVESISTPDPDPDPGTVQHVTFTLTNTIIEYNKAQYHVYIFLTDLPVVMNRYI